MATRPIVPRANGEGSLGVNTAGAEKYWGNVFTQKINDIPVENLGSVPLGFTTPLLQATAPDGWLACQGAEVSRATYPDLWNLVSSTNQFITEQEWQNKNVDGDINIGWYSSGDGTTTFRLPRIVGSGELTEVKRFTTAGAGSFTAPITGIYKITLQGAGGGGGSSGKSEKDIYYGGGGGGQGGHLVFYEKLTAGTSYSFTVGAGGAGGNVNGDAGNSGSAGGDSLITINNNSYIAGGGSGGLQATYYYGRGGYGGDCSINGTVVATKGNPGTFGQPTAGPIGTGGVGGAGGTIADSSLPTSYVAKFGGGGAGGRYNGYEGYQGGQNGGDGYIEFSFNPVPQFWYVRAFGSATNQGTVDITELANMLNAKLSISSVPLITGYNGKQTFTSSGSFTAPVTGLYRITLQGGGGGGGGCGYVQSTHIGGGGGGQGGHLEFYEKLTAGETYSYTVGAGGSGGAASADSISSNGGDGGNSSVTINSNEYVACGGSGGGNTNSTGNGGAGGAGTVNNVTVTRGCSGTSSNTVITNQTLGGSGGGNGGSSGSFTTGGAGTFGGGGSGGGRIGNTNHPGGAGGDGFITFEWQTASLV